VWARSPSPAKNSDIEEELILLKVKRKKYENSSSDYTSSDSDNDIKNKKHKKRKTKKHKKSKKEIPKSPIREKTPIEIPQIDDELMEIEEGEIVPIKFIPPPEVKKEDEIQVGPLPLPKVDAPTKYHGGADMLPGEAEAMAKFVKEKKRIPRRGEIGLSSKEIQKYEEAGFVMSGSRNKRMNAVRLRKEGQVIGAEEKRTLAMLNYEEKIKRETEIVASFKQMISKTITEKLKGQT